MPMRLACAALAVSIATLALPARAASFDCAQARTSVEKAICNDPALGRIDEDIASAYASARAGLDPAMRARLFHNWWLSRSGRVTAADVFKGDGYKLVMARAAREVVSVQCGDQTGTVIGRLIDPDAWGLPDTGIALGVDGYGPGCGRGDVEVDVPWHALRAMLRPEFAAALVLR